MFSCVYDRLDVGYKGKRRIKVEVRAGGCSLLVEQFFSIMGGLYLILNATPSKGGEKSDSQHIWFEPQKVVTFRDVKTEGVVGREEQ